MRPSSYEKVWLPPGTIRAFTVDRWIADGPGVGASMICATAHLTDGRMVRMPGLKRPEGFLRTDAGQSISIQRATGREPWTPAARADGEPLTWSAATDDHVVEYLTALVARHAELGPSDPSLAGAVNLRGLIGHEAPPPITSLPALLRALVPSFPRYRRWERERPGPGRASRRQSGSRRD